MTEDELELAILKRYVVQHAETQLLDPDFTNKCSPELDLRDVLRELTGKTDHDLEHTAGVWFTRLAPGRVGAGRKFPGPLRPCNRPEHKFHARAFMNSEQGTPAWDRIRELEKGGVIYPVQPMATKATKLRLFISHSSEDKKLAALLVELLQIGLHLRSDQIRCTSVPGYKLEGGADTDEQLLFEVRETETLVGILSDKSLRSLYVLFELGARWGTGKPWIPLLSPGTSTSALGGPIGGKNALRADSRDDLLQLVTDLAHQLSVTPDRPAVYSKYIDRILELKPEPEKEAVAQTDRVSRVIANAPTKLTPPSLGSTTYTKPAQTPSTPHVVPDVAAGKRATSPVAITWAPNPNGLDLEIVSSQDDAIRGFTLVVRDLRRRSQSGQFVEVPEFHSSKEFEQLDLEVEKTLYNDAPVKRTFLAVTPGGGLDFKAKRMGYTSREPRNIPKAGIWQVTLLQLSSVGTFSTKLYFEWTPGNAPVPWTPQDPTVTAAAEPLQPVTSINHR